MSRTTTMSPHYKKALAWWILVSVLLAVAAHPLVYRTKISIGLDVGEELEESPRLSWGAGPDQIAEFTRIAPAFTPPGVIARYQIFLSRNAAARGRLELIGVDAAAVQRLYAGTLVPEIFTARPDLSPRTWGIRRTSWRPVRAVAGLAVPLSSPLERSPTTGALFLFAAVAGMTGCLGIAGAIVRAGVRWCLRAGPPAGTLAPAPPWFMRAALFAFPFAVWLVYLAAFFPGLLSYDSVQQWGQGHSMILERYFTPFHTLYIRVLTLAWDSPAAVVLFQMALLSTCLCAAYALLFRAGLPVRLVATAAVLSALSPRNANMALILWKDVPYSACVFLFTVLLARYFLDRTCGGRIGYWLGLGLLLGMMPLFRHNGLAIAAGMVVVMPIVFRHHARQTALCLLVAAAVAGGWKAGVEPRLPFKANDIRPGDLVKLWFTTGRIAYYAYQDVPFSQEEYEFLDSLRPGVLDGWDYTPSSAIPTVTDKYLRFSFARQELPKITSFYLAMIPRYPLLFLRNHLLCNTFLFRLTRPTGEWTEGPWFRIEPNDHGIRHRPLSWRLYLAMSRFTARTNGDAVNWFFWRTALHLYLVIAAGIVLAWRMRDPRLLVVYLPVLLNTASIFLATISQEKRYQYPLALAAGFLVALAFLPRGRKGTEPPSVRQA